MLVGLWWYSVSIGFYWLVYDGTGSVQGGTGRYLAVLGQYGAVLLGTWWCWVSLERNLLIHDDTGWWLKKVEIWTGVTIAGQRQTRKDRATQPMDQRRLR